MTLHSLRFEDKYQCDIRQRFKHLYREKGPMYRRLMGMEESRPLPHVLDKALGKKKYAWMEQSVLLFCRTWVFKLEEAASGW